MAAGNKITDVVFELANPIALEAGCFVDDVEFKKEGADYVLRIIIDVEDDSEGGVSIDQCETVNRALSDILDEKDPISQAYMLEVSSAGLDRAIKYDFHFESCQGKNVDVKLFAAVDGVKEFTAKLISKTGDIVNFEKDGSELSLPENKISSIKLTVEF